MIFQLTAKFFVPAVTRNLRHFQFRQCHSVFGMKSLIVTEKPEFILEAVQTKHHSMALDIIKKHYLPDHVLVRSRTMDMTDDCAVDEYLISLIKQGNTIYAKSEDDKVAGICVGFASSPVDVKNLRAYAFYRQVRIPTNESGLDQAQFEKIEFKDPNTKDFLYFTAKLQETPNLWDTFKQSKIFEIRILAVLPEFRRQGVATALVEASKEQAHDQGYNVIRMDCINPFDYKVAERSMLHCIAKFPLHRLRGPNAPFVKRSSPHNCCVRVYVGTRPQPDTPDIKEVKEKHRELEELLA